MKKYFCTIFLLSIFSSFAQNIDNTKFNNKIISENFENDNSIFPTITNEDNYFIIDNGDYLISRNNKQSEYAILSSSEKLKDYILKTSIRIGPENIDNSSIGIIIKAQEDGKGALVLEINGKQEYRIKQLVGSKYEILSGNKNKGWIKNDNINIVNQYNEIEIRVENNIYEVFINDFYINSIFISDYTSGLSGILIAPQTKARIAR